MSEETTPNDEVTEQDVERAMAVYSGDGQIDDPSGGDTADELLQQRQEDAGEAPRPFIGPA